MRASTDHVCRCPMHLLVHCSRACACVYDCVRMPWIDSFQLHTWHMHARMILMPIWATTDAWWSDSSNQELRAGLIIDSLINCGWNLHLVHNIMSADIYFRKKGTKKKQCIFHSLHPRWQSAWMDTCGVSRDVIRAESEFWWSSWVGSHLLVDQRQILMWERCGPWSKQPLVVSSADYYWSSAILFSW